MFSKFKKINNVLVEIAIWRYCIPIHKHPKSHIIGLYIPSNILIFPVKPSLLIVKPPSFNIVFHHVFNMFVTKISSASNTETSLLEVVGAHSSLWHFLRKNLGVCHLSVVDSKTIKVFIIVYLPTKNILEFAILTKKNLDFMQNSMNKHIESCCFLAQHEWISDTLLQDQDAAILGTEQDQGSRQFFLASFPSDSWSSLQKCPAENRETHRIIIPIPVGPYGI